MKKLSSMLALSLALAMVLGMTAFADGPSPEIDIEMSSKTKGVTAKVVADKVDDLEKVLGADEYNKFYEKYSESTPAGAVEGSTGYLLAVVDLSGTKPESGKVELECSQIAAADADEWVFYAYHYRNGVCEVLPVTILGDGLIQISGIEGFSNFVIVAFPKAVTTTGDNGNNAITNTNAGTSPKTGESTSMAMLIVLVSLAGASVLGAKRAFSAR